MFTTSARSGCGITVEAKARPSLTGSKGNLNLANHFEHRSVNYSSLLLPYIIFLGLIHPGRKQLAHVSLIQSRRIIIIVDFLNKYPIPF